MESPTLRLATRIAATFHGRPVRRVRRFPLGLCHHVFDVETDDQPFVVRIATPGNEPMLEGTIHWTPLLRSVDVPVPAILYADLTKRIFPFAYLVLERLQGTDLLQAHPSLSRGARTKLGRQMGELQARVGTLPMGRRFGSARSYQDPDLHDNWQGVLTGLLARTQRRWSAGTGLSMTQLDRLDAAISAASRLWTSIRSRPFLEDATTKNVIVTPSGRLSGIVDLDTLGLGDPLFALALTRASFAMHGWDEAYTQAWAAASAPDSADRHRVALYTALFCADILSEQGARHNRSRILRFSRAQAVRLRTTFETELAQAGRVGAKGRL